MGLALIPPGELLIISNGAYAIEHATDHYERARYGHEQ